MLLILRKIFRIATGILHSPEQGVWWQMMADTTFYSSEFVKTVWGLLRFYSYGMIDIFPFPTEPKHVKDATLI